MALIGVRAHDFAKQTPEALARGIAAAGFGAVQLAPYKALDLPEAEMLSEANILRIRRAFDGAGLSIAVLGCYVEPGSPDVTLYNASRVKFAAHLRAAKALGAACVGTETTHYDGPEEEREAAYTRVLSFARRMVLEADAAGTYVAVEPVWSHTINTPELMRRLLDEVNHPRLKVIFDPVNLLANAEDAGQQHLMWDRCVACFGDDVIAIHIKDAIWRPERGEVQTALGEGAMEYALLRAWLRTKAANIPLLREGAHLDQTDREIAFIRALR